MKPLHIFLVCVLAVAALMACNQQKKAQDQQTQPPQTFPSAREAALKAKSDLLAIQRSDQKIQLAPDMAALEAAEPGEPIRYVTLDFQKLLQADSAANLDQLAMSSVTSIVPMNTPNGIVTVVQLSQDDKGWQVAGIGDREIADDLQTLRGVLGDAFATSAITIYHLPNLESKLYSVKTPDGERLYTRYQDRFDLREGRAPAQVLPILKADAAQFEKAFGEQLRKGRLVR